VLYEQQHAPKDEADLAIHISLSFLIDSQWPHSLDDVDTA